MPAMSKHGNGGRVLLTDMHALVRALLSVRLPSLYAGLALC